MICYAYLVGGVNYMAVKSVLHEDYSVAELGSVFGLGTNTLKDKLQKMNVAPSSVSRDGIRKRYTLTDVHVALMELQKSELTSNGLDEPKSHRERLDFLKANEQEIKNRELEGRLVDKEAVVHEFAQALSTIKNRLLVLPKKFGIRAIELMDARLIEDEIENEIRTVLQELSEYDTTADSSEGDAIVKTTTEADD